MPVTTLIERAGGPVNPYLTILVTRDGAMPDGVAYHVVDWRDGPHPRTIDTVGYLRRLRARVTASGAEAGPAESETIVFQAEDVGVDVSSASWQTRRGWAAVRLVPDLYYYAAGGHEDFLADPSPLPDWEARPVRFSWRGSTSGIVQLAAAQLDELPRYRVARIAQAFAGDTDIGFTEIVQAASEADHEAITARLTAEGLVRPYVPMPEMAAAARYIFDIDGNANSWNFMAKLRLGSCVVKVESDWLQWFSERLAPWRHYVPVAHDLADLAEKMAWCLDNPTQSARIAAQGRQFALDMRFDDEMDQAARTVWLAERPVTLCLTQES